MTTGKMRGLWAHSLQPHEMRHGKAGKDSQRLHGSMPNMAPLAILQTRQTAREELTGWIIWQARKGWE